MMHGQNNIKELEVSIEQELVWPRRLCGSFAEEINLLRLLRIGQGFPS
jgi:hypothetical protein